MEHLEKKVIEFVKSQPESDKKPLEKIKASFDDPETYMVIYGDNLWDGIGGTGPSPADAYSDFVRSWKELKGFEWIEKHK